MKTLIAILAAGESSRLGKPKQLIEKNSQSLLKHTIDQCSGLGEVFVITGAFREPVTKEIGKSISIQHNVNWKKGMGSSIKVAAVHAAKNQANQLLITAVDLPKVESRHYKSLLTLARNSNKKITCAGYSDTYGIPAIFSKSIFQELEQIPDTEGAKSIIAKHMSETEILQIPEAAYDVDYPSDAESYWS